MKDLKGTKTLENLLTAFAGESEAKQVHLLCGKKPRKMVTSKLRASSWKLPNERNTELWFKLAHGIGTTEENLLDAAAGRAL